MADLNRIPRILYFHPGMVPTQQDRDDASRFGVNVGFRNSHQVATVAMSPLEECDAVAGDVPDRYAKVYPNVNDFDARDRMLRMSDLDRRHGPVHSVDNESARAAKPPAAGQESVLAQGATRPRGAHTLAGGGWVAPLPGNPDGQQAHGSERSENAPEGYAGEGTQGAKVNPQGLPDSGVTLPPTGTEAPPSTGAVAEGGGQSGFKPPEPVDTEEETKEEKPTGKRPGEPTFE